MSPSKSSPGFQLLLVSLQYIGRGYIRMSIPEFPEDARGGLPPNIGEGSF